jgi:hypothetical protein
MSTNRPALMRAIHRLAVAGEQAGFSVEHMIRLLNDGLTVEALLELIAGRLDGIHPETFTVLNDGSRRRDNGTHQRCRQVVQ